MFATLEPGTILLASGDAIALPLIYLQQVEGRAPNVTVVLMPLLAANWYVEQLRARYRNYKFPSLATMAGRTISSRWSKRTRPAAVCIAGRFDNDNSLDRDYWARPRGLVTLVEPKTNEANIGQIVSDNESLLRSYRPPPAANIRPDGFEQDILGFYAWPAFRIGQQYERAGSRREARTWYEKAMAIDPNMPELHTALSRTN